jgi:hypothetical protein
VRVLDFGLAFGRDLDVRGLEVAVNDALLVRRFEGVGDPKRLDERDRPVLQATREVLALDQLYHQRRAASRLLEQPGLYASGRRATTGSTLASRRAGRDVASIATAAGPGETAA